MLGTHSGHDLMVSGVPRTTSEQEMPPHSADTDVLTHSAQVLGVVHSVQTVGDAQSAHVEAVVVTAREHDCCPQVD